MAVHRGRRLEDWVELAAAAVERARRALGKDEVARRVEHSVSDADYETTVRVLRTMGRDLQSTDADLTALDARLRGAHVDPHTHVPEAPEDAARAEVELEAAGAARTALEREGADAVPGTRAPRSFALDDDDASARPNPEPSLDDLPPKERGAVRPSDLAKELLRLRNPILPHPRHGRGK